MFNWCLSSPNYGNHICFDPSTTNAHNGHNSLESSAFRLGQMVLEIWAPEAMEIPTTFHELLVFAAEFWAMTNI